MVYLHRQAPIEKIETIETSMEEISAAGNETILIIDDEKVIREMGQRIFERFGYKVLLADDGKAGLELFAERMNDIDLVLLDQTMPRLSGLEVLKKIRDYTWDKKVVMTSGYQDDDDLQKYKELNSSGFIPKPFDIYTLVSKVREILEA